MGSKPWREISAKNRMDSERLQRVEAGAWSILLESELTRLRESRGITQAELASSLALSQARISQIEHQNDLNLSTLGQFVHGMGGVLRVVAEFSDTTVTIFESSADEPGKFYRQ
jgi:DNA-binding XRE family transcriptional regulator